MKTKRKTKEHPVRRIAPSMAYLHPLRWRCATIPIQRNGSLNTARRVFHSPSATNPLALILSLSLAARRATRLLPIHPLAMPLSFSSRYFRNAAPEISRAGLVRVYVCMRALCDCAIVCVCEDEHAPKRIATFPDAISHALSRTRAKAARTNKCEARREENARSFSRRTDLHSVRRSFFQ